MENVLEEFLCPVCVNYMAPPIKLCVEGHSICDTCDKKLEICPICRGQKFGSRNLSVENIFNKIDVPCFHTSEGCTAIVKGSDWAEHKLTCFYSIRKCPMKTLNNCGWTGKIRDIINHCMECHPRNVFNSSQLNLLYPSCLNAKLQLSIPIDRFSVMTKCYGELFKCIGYIDTCKMKMEWAVFHITPFPYTNTDKFEFGITLVNINNTLEIRLLGRRADVQRNGSNITTSVFFDANELETFGGPSGLQFHIVILKATRNALTNRTRKRYMCSKKLKQTRTIKLQKHP